ncbi:MULTISPECIES: CZB domain-containing protein [unclassified Enterobacter]|uniref:CZB domain-containing protein n=1 Tax=unclassified Enterobacter TaxID=2608935 RepID=UPI0008EF9BE0|nr:MULTISPECIES: CZB domain-containing protein [unclassified Enterobacter]SFR18288.1 Chemoreceptor zinc-binding domain-containing protein [Enterobacter sp. kpr-6]
MEIRSWIKRRIEGENVALGVPAERQNLNGLIFEEAIAFHIAWRERWLTALREHRGNEFDVAQVSSDAVCKVGNWIYNEGAALSRHPEYEHFRLLHAKFHTCAGKIVDLHQKGRFLDAFAAVSDELMPLSEEVGLSLGALLEATQR